MKSFHLSVFMLGALFFLCTCTSQPDVQVIGFSQCSKDDWRTAMNKEAMQEVSFHPGLELRIKSVKDDTQQQIKDVEQFIADRVDLIILVPNEAEPLVEVVEKAMEAGIPVVLADRKIASDHYTAFVGADNYTIGHDAGIYIAERLHGRGRVFEIQGLTGSSPATERHAGFMDAIRAYPGIEVVASVDGGWFRHVAESETRRFMATGQPVDLIFAHNDQMALGASSVYLEVEKKRPEIVGIDALAGPDGGIQMVLDGRIDATFLYPTGGERVVQTAFSILNGLPYNRDNRLYTAVVDKTNARVLKLQTDQITEQQEKLAKLNNALDESLVQYATQRFVLYASLGVLVVFFVLLAMLMRANWKANRINRLLKERNALVSKQRAELTEQRDQLALLSKDLEDATQAKLVFFTNVSHEFRTPLTLISGPLDQIVEQEQLSERGKNMVLLIRQNIKVLQRLIDQIIDFRKVENGKMKMAFNYGDFKGFVENVVNSFRQLAAEKHLHLQCNASGEDFYMWFDAEKIEKICYNLLSNALKYTPENGRVVVTLSHMPDFQGKEAVRLQVADTGVGIPAEHLPHVFERFYKVDDKVMGSGIGLNLTKMLVDLHGGNISVESELGKGTCFTVIIPMEHREKAARLDLLPAKVQQEESSWVQTASMPDDSDLISGQFEDSGKPLVLLVEDNADMRLYLKTLLIDDYRVLEASNGVVGLQNAMVQIPELVVSDVMMEGMDGFELCKQLKCNLSTCHIPVILLTACSLDEQRAEGFESGADAYISKPFNDKLLKIRIRKLIENRAQIKEHFRETLTFGEGKRAVTKMDKALIEKIRQIVMDNLANNELGVDELGSMVGLSRVQLYRKLKALTNYSPNEFVRVIRLKEAEKLLVRGEKSISEIAYETGFSSPAYFTKCFKEFFKEAPSVYVEHLKAK